MLEYIFFNEITCQLFKKSATSSGITSVINCAEDSFTVRLDEDLDEDLLQKLEDYYDELMDMDRTLSEQQQEGSV